MYRSRFKKSRTNRLHTRLLDIGREGTLQREIKDVIDELDMMIHLGRQQTKVLKRFKRLVQQMIDPVKAGDEPGAKRDILTLRAVARTRSGLEAPAGHRCPENLKVKYDWFSGHAMILLEDMEERIGELEDLKKSAVSTAENVRWPFSVLRGIR